MTTYFANKLCCYNVYRESEHLPAGILGSKHGVTMKRTPMKLLYKKWRHVSTVYLSNQKLLMFEKSKSGFTI